MTATVDVNDGHNVDYDGHIISDRHAWIWPSWSTLWPSWTCCVAVMVYGRLGIGSILPSACRLSDFLLLELGRRAFPVAGARIWNDLPSLFTFKRHLKMHLFRLSCPDLTL